MFWFSRAGKEKRWKADTCSALFAVNVGPDAVDVPLGRRLLDLASQWARKPRREVGGAGEGHDLGHDSPVLEGDVEGFLSLFGMSGECPIGEAEARLCGSDVHDPTWCENKDRPQAPTDYYRAALLDRGSLRRNREPGGMMCSPLADGLLRPTPIYVAMADADYEVVMAVTRGQAAGTGLADLFVGDLFMAGSFEHIS
jgi:hypothetical protein